MPKGSSAVHALHCRTTITATSEICCVCGVKHITQKPQHAIVILLFAQTSVERPAILKSKCSGKARQGKARQGKAGQGKAMHALTGRVAPMGLVVPLAVLFRPLRVCWVGLPGRVALLCWVLARVAPPSPAWLLMVMLA